MHSTLAPHEADPHDCFTIEPDVVVAARVEKTSADPAPDGRPSAPQILTTSDAIAGVSAPSVDATFRAASVDNIKLPSDRPAMSKWARRALMSFLFGLCSAFAAEGWAHYGDAAKAMALSWAPKFAQTSSPPQETPGVAEQPSSPLVQTAAADQATAPLAQSAQSVAPSVAPLPPESAQLLQSMSQQIEQLKASIEQLKTGQEQMSRDIARNSEAKTAQAKTSEQSLRPRIPAPQQRSASTPARKPRLAFAPAQAVAAPTLPPTAATAPSPLLQPGPPAQAAARPAVEPVVRPPMPLPSRASPG